MLDRVSSIVQNYYALHGRRVDSWVNSSQKYTKNSSMGRKLQFDFEPRALETVFVERFPKALKEYGEKIKEIGRVITPAVVNEMVEEVGALAEENSKPEKGEEPFRLGIYFGAFNPPHLGHLTLAEASLLYNNCYLDGMVFMPGVDSEKKPFTLSSGTRLTLLQELLSSGGADYTPFYFSTLRIDLYNILEKINFPIYGYASKRRWADVFALRILQEMNKKNTVFPYFIVGEDKLVGFVERENKELLVNGVNAIGSKLLCYPRGGVSQSLYFPKWLIELWSKGFLQWNLEEDEKTISSSDIRKALAQNAMRHRERMIGDELGRLFVCSDPNLRKNLINLFLLEQEWRGGSWHYDTQARKRINQERERLYKIGLLANPDHI